MIFQASTPEALRLEFVKWLKDCASHHRIQAHKAVRVAIRVEETVIAKTYEDIANFLERAEINVS